MMRADARTDVAGWAKTGGIAPSRVREALIALDAIPTRDAWVRYLDRMLAWLGAVALAAALGFFIAANWQLLGRFGKLALVEAVVVVAIAVVAWQGLDTLRGRAALFVAALAVGTLLAFVGQTYQTGADSYELFVAWAIAILPWALVARQPALWLLWVGLLDMAAWLYAGLSLQWFGLLFGPRVALWMILAIHLTALAAWELAIQRGIAWLDVRYGVRLLATGAGVAATALVVEAIVAGRGRDERLWLALLAYLALLGGLYYAYRVRRVDPFILAAAVLSVIVVIVTALGEAGLFDGFGGFLVAGVVIVAIAGAGAHWLRGLVREAAR
jgi:uncharacterized membrane protein